MTPTMESTTREALEKSIEHWRLIADGSDNKIGPKHCELCKLFRKPTQQSLSGHGTGFKCFGCPVLTKTRKHLCEGTPYENAECFWGKYGNEEKFRAAAKLELAFLESLRPVEAKA